MFVGAFLLLKLSTFRTVKKNLSMQNMAIGLLIIHIAYLLIQNHPSLPVIYRGTPCNLAVYYDTNSLSRFCFASGSPDNIKIWKLPDGNFLQNFTGHQSIVNTLAINSDGVLVSGGIAHTGILCSGTSE